MRNRLIHLSQFAAFILLLSGCTDGAPSSEATAPETADPAASSSAVGGTEIVRFKAQGSHATAGFMLEQPGHIVFGHIEVQRGGINNPGETLLFYFLNRCERLGTDHGDCVFLEEGVGTIPNGDFTVRGNVSTLRTNTAANPSFILLAGSGGTIVFQWTRTTERVSQIQEHRRTRMKGVEMFHERRSSSSSTAITGGTMLGFTIQAAPGFVGATRTGSIVLSKVP
jgi:hypothetical protein